MNWKFLIDPSYYLSARPSIGYFGWLMPLLVIFALMLVAGLYIKVVYGVYQRKHPYYQVLSNKIFSWLWTTGCLGLLYLFFRYEGIMFLSSRILLIILLIIFFYWGYNIWFFAKKDFQQMKKQYHSNIEKKKYWPKKRK